MTGFWNDGKGPKDPASLELTKAQKLKRIFDPETQEALQKQGERSQEFLLREIKAQQKKDSDSFQK